MEISLKDTIYTINHTRIIYIEYYKTIRRESQVRYDVLYGDSQNTRFNPFTSDIPAGIEESDLIYLIRIHMTDDEFLEFSVDDNIGFEKLKEKFEKIIGG